LDDICSSDTTDPTVWIQSDKILKIDP